MCRVDLRVVDGLVVHMASCLDKGVQDPAGARCPLHHGHTQFSSCSRFESAYLVMHWSDGDDTMRNMVLQTVLVMHISFRSCSLCAPRTRLINACTPSTVLEESPGYMAMGRDGFDALAAAEVLMDAERGHIISALLRTHLAELKVVSQWHRHELDHEWRVKARALMTADASVTNVNVARCVAHAAYVRFAKRWSAHELLACIISPPHALSTFASFLIYTLAHLSRRVATDTREVDVAKEQ
jgi:hypothetical protein